MSVQDVYYSDQWVFLLKAGAIARRRRCGGFLGKDVGWK